MWAEIGGSNGETGWTFNGYEGIQGKGAYSSGALLSNRAMAFCADNAGGRDGGEPEKPLCNQNGYYGTYFSFGNELYGTTTVYNYTVITGAVIHYLDTAWPNVVWAGRGCLAITG